MPDTNNTRPNSSDKATRLILMAVALGQGVLLYLLHLSVTSGSWPASDGRWLYALYSWGIGLPLVYLFGIGRGVDRRSLLPAVILTPLLLVTGWHLDWVVGDRSRELFVALYVLTLGFALFVASVFFQEWSSRDNGRRLTYEGLVRAAWWQSLALGYLGLFVGVFWLLLALWSGLFDAIGIAFFGELFARKGFVYIATWLVVGIGIVAIRSRNRLIDTVQDMCESLTRALLPVTAFVVVLFVATLLFTGVQPIWDTGYAASLMMMLSGLLLFFLTVALGEEPWKGPLAAWPVARRLVTASVLLLPVLAGLAVWALVLRIDQYGVSLDRLWAAVILGHVLAYVAGLAVLLVWKREAGWQLFGRVNTIFAVLVGITLVLVNTPLADLRKWAAHSQAERLLNGETEASEFDFWYLRSSLGSYGIQELNRIKSSELATADPALTAQIDAVLKANSRSGTTAPTPKDLAALLSIVPEGAVPPPELLGLVANEQGYCLAGNGRCAAVMPMSSESGADWFVVTERYGHGRAYRQADHGWQEIGRVERVGCDTQPGTGAPIQAIHQVRASSLVYSDGNCLYAIDPEYDYLRLLVLRE